MLAQLPEIAQESSRILVVDDNEDVRVSLSDILAEIGYEVSLAENGMEALNIIESESVNLVITDLKMPGLSGLELLRVIREQNKHFPVIILTGFPSIHTAIEAMKGGAIDFITKPFDIHYIEHIVKKILNEQRLQIENQYLLAQVNQKAVIESLNERLNKKIIELQKLYAISEALNVFTDNDNLFVQIVKTASDVTDAERVSLLLYDKEEESLSIRASLGVPKDIRENVVVKLGEGISGRVAKEKKLLRVNRFSIGNHVRQDANHTYASFSFLSLPLYLGEELFGVLNLTDKHCGTDFTEEDESLMLSLVNKASMKIENNALYEGIYLTLMDTLRSLVTTIEAKDPYTKMHSQRVTDIALLIAQEMGCSEEEREILAFAGILHDIGKIGISDSVLQKKGTLDDREFEIVKMHPQIGESIVEPLGLIEEEKDIIRHHHERIDGKGYPDGLKKAELSLLTRILTVADAFDAMISDRPYRAAMKPDVALQILNEQSFMQFDEDVVKVLKECFRNGKVTPIINLDRHSTKGEQFSS